MLMNSGDRANSKANSTKANSTPTDEGASHSELNEKSAATSKSVTELPVELSDKENKRSGKKGKTANPTSFFRAVKASTSPK